MEHALLIDAPPAGASSRTDHAAALAAVAANARAYADLPETLRDDEDVTFAAACGWQWVDAPTPFKALRHASARLRRDPAFLDRLMRSKPEEYEALDEDLKADPAILERVFGGPRCAWWMLEDAPESVQRDPKWAALAVEAEPWALRHARGAVVDDFDLALRAVSRDGRALKFLSPRLRDDDTIAKAAILSGQGFPSGASDRLRDDEDFIVSALAHVAMTARRMDWTTEEVERNIMQRGASKRVKAKLEAEGRAPVYPDLVLKPISDDDIPF